MAVQKESYETLSQAVEGLKGRGYTHDFTRKRDHLYCETEDKRVNPTEFEIEEAHRFEGMTNPDDNSVVYAINGAGMKGILIDAYGVYAEDITPEMAKKLSVDHDVKGEPVEPIN